VLFPLKKTSFQALIFLFPLLLERKFIIHFYTNFSAVSSLAVIALKLKEVFECNDINELPIIYNISWYEQKAVIVLLSLLYLGVKNIHLGPTLPAFLSPNVAKVLVDNFGISGIGTVEEDIELFFGK
ncbi:hypothetical protein ACTQ3U_10750, partial [Oscillospiraceae bacterium LCP25S3_F9]